MSGWGSYPNPSRGGPPPFRGAPPSAPPPSYDDSSSFHQQQDQYQNIPPRQQQQQQYRYPPPRQGPYPPQRYPPQQHYPNRGPPPPIQHQQGYSQSNIQRYPPPPRANSQQEHYNNLPPSAPQPPPQSQWQQQFYNRLQPDEMRELRQWFSSVDTDGSGAIDATELSRVRIGNVEIGIDTASKLVKTFDSNGTGEIDFYEYASLHKFLKTMQQAFVAADGDRNGVLDTREIHDALARGGFHNVTLSAVRSFFERSNNPQGLTCDTFFNMCATFSLARTKFSKAGGASGSITLSLDQLFEFIADL